MFGNHLVEIRGLMEIGRYQNKFKHVRRSVAEHLVLRAKPDYSAKLIVKPSGSPPLSLQTGYSLLKLHNKNKAYLKQKPHNRGWWSMAKDLPLAR